MDISCHSPSLRIHRARRIVSIELRHARWSITIDFAGKRGPEVVERGTIAFVNGGNSGTSSECSIPSGIHISSRSPRLLPPRRGGLPSGRLAQILHTLPGLYYETTPRQTVTVHRESALHPSFQIVKASRRIVH
jgi:hypothetical protein